MHKIVLIAAGLTLAASPAFAAVDFEKEVSPILAEHCIQCHGEEKQKGKFRLDQKADAFKPGKSGATPIVAGDADKSEIHRRITLPKDSDEVMPPEDGPVPEKSIAILKAWLAEGANWPDGVVVKVAAKAGAPAAVAPTLPAMPGRPVPPLPELPKDFKPAAGETAAIAALAKDGVEARAIAQNVPWREANFRLKGPEVTDKTLDPLQQIPSLVEVRLGNTKVTDAGLSALAPLQHLQVLGLELTGITDAGLDHVGKLGNLVYLNLYGTKVTDAGIQRLAGLKHLRNLYLWQTQVTPEGVKKLQEALPGCDINTGAELVVVPPPEKKAEEKK